MRLIDADALKAEIHKDWDDVLVWDESGETTAEEFERLVDDQPTVDAAPIRRGKWDKNKIACHWKCSECGAAVFDNLGAVFDYTGNEGLNYCPNCGAKME